MNEHEYPYDDVGDDAYDADTRTAPSGQNDKLKRILNELDALKDDLTRAGVGAKKTAPEQRASDESALLEELNRLRAEHKKAQDEQQMNNQLARMREDLMRDLNARSQGAQVYDELNRMSRRLENLERGDAYRASGNGYDYRRTPSAQMDEELGVRLMKIENMLSEMSVLLIAHDVTPIAREVTALKNMLSERKDDELGGYGDKVLDEIVRVQTSLEDVKLLLERDPDRDPFDDGLVIQENLFDTKTLDQITKVSDELKQGFERLDEQMSSILSDLNIYSGEGYGNGGVAEALQSIRTRLDESLPKTQMLVEGLVGLREAIVAFSSNSALNERLDEISDHTALTLDLVNELKVARPAPHDPTSVVNTLSLVAAKLDAFDLRLEAIENAVAYIPMPIAQEQPTASNEDAILSRLDALTARVEEQLESARAADQGIAEMKKADAKPLLQAIADALRSLDQRLSAVEQGLAQPREIEIDYASLRAALKDVVREELAAKNDPKQ